MIQKLVTCPNPELLNNFLLGRLSSDEFESYEEHLASCDPCIETLHGLQVEEDTLDGLAQAAWRSNEVKSEEESDDSQIVQQLIERMQQMGDASLGSDLDRSSQASEDRAAEVQRLLKPSKDPQSIGQLAHYRIIRLLGAGSTGIVYLAIDELLQREVALKILKPSLGNAARDRFIAEARATALIDHPNVISIFAVGQEGSLAYIAMRWQDGKTLDQLLRDQETLSVEQVKTLGTQLSAGLAAAHRQGLIHRDIKPANVWIPSDNRPAVILDFGLVRISDEDPQLTCTGMIAGTPCFMSPEQSRGQTMDGRSDLFSLGCLLYQSLTGKLPFHSNNALATLQSIQRDQPAAPFELDPSIPKDLSDLVLCLLEKSPKRRPETAEMVSVALNTRRSDWPFHVLDSNAVPRQSRAKTKRGSGKLLAFIAVLVVAFSGLVWSGFGTHITRIVTNQGEIVIDTLVDDVKIEVLRDGEHIQVIDLATDKSIVIKAGEYEIRQLGDRNSVQIQNGTLTLSRGEKEVVRITRATTNTTDATGRDLGDELVGFDQFDQDAAQILEVGQTRRVQLGFEFKGIQMRGRGNVRVKPATFTEVDVTGLRVGTAHADFLLRGGKMRSVTFEVRQTTNSSGEDQDLDPVVIERLPKFIRVQLGETKRIDLGFKCPEIQIEDPKLLFATPVSPSEVEVKGLKLGSSRVHFKDVEGVMHSTMVRVHEPPYLLDSGDILAILIDGVLGSLNAPEVHNLPDGNSTVPSIGLPVPVDEEGRISLPLIDPISVRGKTVTEVKEEICDRYESGGNPILNRAIVLINLVRRRDFQLPLSDAVSAKIASLKIELAELEQRLGANHPKIVSLKKQIESLENTSSPNMPGGETRKDGDSPSMRVVGSAGELQAKVFGARSKAERSVEQDIQESIRILQQARELIRSSDVDQGTKEALLKIVERDLRDCREIATQKEKVTPQPMRSEVGGTDGLGGAEDMDEPPVNQDALDELTHLRALLRNTRSDLAMLESPDWSEAIKQLSKVHLEISEAQYPSDEVRDLVEQVSEDIKSLEEVSSGIELEVDRLSQLGRYVYLHGKSDKRDGSVVPLDSELELETPKVMRLRAKLALLDSEAEQAEFHQTLRELVQIRKEQYASLLSMKRAASKNNESTTAIESSRAKCRSELSKIRFYLRDFEKENRLRPTEPVFEGRNYEEWRMLTKPGHRSTNYLGITKGLVYLADDNMKREAFRTTIGLVKELEDRSPKGLEIRDFLKEELLPKLSMQSAVELLVDELDQGNRYEIDFLLPNLLPELVKKFHNASEETRNRQFVPQIEQIVDSICRTAEGDSPNAVQVGYSYLNAVFEAFPNVIVIDDNAKRIVQRRFDEYFQFAPLSTGPSNLVQHLASEIDGLSKKIETIFAENDFEDADKTIVRGEIHVALNCLERLSTQQKKEVFPSMIRFLKTMPKGTLASVWSTRIIDILKANPGACVELVDELSELQERFDASAKRLVNSGGMDVGADVGAGGGGSSTGRRRGQEEYDMPDAAAKKLSDLIQGIQEKK